MENFSYFENLTQFEVKSKLLEEASLKYNR